MIERVMYKSKKCLLAPVEEINKIFSDNIKNVPDNCFFLSEFNRFKYAIFRFFNIRSEFVEGYEVFTIIKKEIQNFECFSIAFFGSFDDYYVAVRIQKYKNNFFIDFPIDFTHSDDKYYLLIPFDNECSKDKYRLMTSIVDPHDLDYWIFSINDESQVLDEKYIPKIEIDLCLKKKIYFLSGKEITSIQYSKRLKISFLDSGKNKYFFAESEILDGIVSLEKYSGVRLKKDKYYFYRTSLKNKLEFRDGWDK